MIDEYKGKANNFFRSANGRSWHEGDAKTIF